MQMLLNPFGQIDVRCDITAVESGGASTAAALESVPPEQRPRRYVDEPAKNDELAALFTRVRNHKLGEPGGAGANFDPADAASAGTSRSAVSVIEECRLLFAYPLDVNEQDSNGWTPLHHAARGGHQLAVE